MSPVELSQVTVKVVSEVMLVTVVVPEVAPFVSKSSLVQLTASSDSQVSTESPPSST